MMALTQLRRGQLVQASARHKALRLVVCMARLDKWHDDEVISNTATYILHPFRSRLTTTHDSSLYVVSSKELMQPVA
jgi:hypothetical protein